MLLLDTLCKSINNKNAYVLCEQPLIILPALISPCRGVLPHSAAGGAAGGAGHHGRGAGPGRAAGGGRAGPGRAAARGAGEPRPHDGAAE